MENRDFILYILKMDEFSNFVCRMPRKSLILEIYFEQNKNFFLTKNKIFIYIYNFNIIIDKNKKILKLVLKQ